MSVHLSVRHHFVSALYLEYFSTDLFKLYIRVDIGEELLGIIGGSICQISTDILPFVENWFRCSILANCFIIFLQTLNESRYKNLGVIWDCKSLNFVKKNYWVTALDLKIWWNFEYKILVETTAFFIHKYGPWFMDCHCNKIFHGRVWCMPAALLFYFLGFILQILSWTFFHILFPAIWLTMTCNLPPPLPISIDLRQQTKILQLYIYIWKHVYPLCVRVSHDAHVK